MRLLIAEDEKDLNMLITKKLKSAGYSVDSCEDGAEAIDFVDAADYDAVILDIMMPQKSGFDVLEHIRSIKPHTPVLFLTARDSISDRVLGLDSGANDYLVKPFSFEELLARIRVLTRTSFGSVSSTLKVADLVVDTKAHSVVRNGINIELSAKEFALLEYLMHNAGLCVTREQIENHIWNFDYEGGTNIVDVYVSYLRKKIDGNSDVKLIHTIRGKGYTIKVIDK